MNLAGNPRLRGEVMNADFTSAAGLVFITLRGCNLTGMLDDGFWGEMRDLQLFDVRFNRILAPLPSTEGSDVELRANQLCGLGQEPPQLANETACTPCDYNFYKDVEGNDLRCVPCPSTSITRKVGSTSKNDCICPEGEGFIKNQANFDADGGLPACECPAGHYLHKAKSVAEKDMCKKCPPGRYQESQGREETCSQTCKDLVRQSTEPGATSAVACECIEEKGFVAGDNGTCVCPKGKSYDVDDKKCVPCALNSFKANESATDCTFCGDEIPGAITEEEGSDSIEACVCNSGFYKDEDGRSCVPCPTNEVDCSQPGSELSTFRLKPGFYRQNNGTLDIRPCPSDKACIGGNGTNSPNESEPYCSENHHGACAWAAPLLRREHSQASDAILLCRLRHLRERLLQQRQWRVRGVRRC